MIFEIGGALVRVASALLLLFNYLRVKEELGDIYLDQVDRVSD